MLLQLWSLAFCLCVSLSWCTQSSSLKTKRCSKTLCITKDLSRNGYDTVSCTFQLIDLMRIWTKKKSIKKAYQTKLLQWLTSFGHPGTERSRKTGKNAGNLTMWSLIPSNCLSRVSLGVPFSTGSLCKHQRLETSRQIFFRRFNWPGKLPSVPCISAPC